MPRVGFKSIDDYIATHPAPAQAVLKRVRGALRKALLGATEGISYQIPVYKLNGKMVLYFAGFKNHYSIYPATPKLIGELKQELAGFLHNRATIRFSYEDTVPTQLITKIAKLRAAEAAQPKLQSVKKKTASKQGKRAVRGKR